MQQMNQTMCSTIDDFDGEIQKWQQVIQSAQGCPSVEIEAQAQIGALDTWRRALEQSLTRMQNLGPEMQQRGQRDVMDTCTKAHTAITVSKQRLEQEYGIGDQPLEQIGMENIFPAGMSQTYGMGMRTQQYGTQQYGTQQYGMSRTNQQYGMGRSQMYGTMGRMAQQYETPEQYGRYGSYGATQFRTGRETSLYGSPYSTVGNWSPQTGMSQFGTGRETAQRGSTYGTTGRSFASSMGSQRYGQEVRDPYSREFGREPLRVQELRQRYGSSLYRSPSQTQQYGQSSRMMQKNW
jgi:hypothetical protein